MKNYYLIVTFFSSGIVFAAENKIDYPGIGSDIGFEQIQALKFSQEDQRLAYGDDPLQFGKLYLPKNSDSPHPLIVFIHGGCWLNIFDMSHAYAFLTGLAQEGLAVWSLEYRRTGDTGGGWPGTYEDIKAGIRYLSSLESFGVDTENFLIAGHSAGGHLSLLAGTETPDAQGVIALAPITNIISYSQGSVSCEVAATQFIGSSYNQNPSAYRQANPAEKTPHRNSIIFHGTLDAIVPIEQSRLTGARTELHEGVSHFDWIHPGSEAFANVVKAAKEMLQ